MSIQWQQGAVFDGAYTHVADVGDGITLHVWREEPGVWCWYAKRGLADYPAYHSEQGVTAAKAAAAAWWNAHGRILTVRRVVYGHKRTFLVGTGADETPPPGLVEQPVEARQEIAKVAADSAEALERSIGSLTGYATSLERTLDAMREVVLDLEHLRMRETCVALREAIARLEEQRSALLNGGAEG
ncbi:hypothetical protein UFOVP397_33 [uncultured Caudovirales phage]|uniref:Uncharacterized protein n=1 Tax=uncultured Caudovirales phage TaxID=2100421 RepID=A0A6J5M3P6_9CAUD|nr:hypothetical protein UFOVP397_33 [uncultured Caudovirales phage]